MPFASGRNSIAICDRCSFQVPFTTLMPDPNYHGLLVCADCRDELDPWRKPALKTDAICLKYPRPDVPLVPGDE